MPLLYCAPGIETTETCRAAINYVEQIASLSFVLCLLVDPSATLMRLTTTVNIHYLQEKQRKSKSSLLKSQNEESLGSVISGGIKATNCTITTTAERRQTSLSSVD